MSVEDFGDFVAHSKQHFEEGLIRAGFAERDGIWRGVIDHRAGSTEVRITLSARFPFKPPGVFPHDPNAAPWSWHREIDGALCLVADDDHQDLWWTDAPAFLDHVAAWFERSDAGWIGDRPDLDLDRYFHPSDDEHLYLYGELDGYSDSFVRFSPGANNVMKLTGGGTRPTKPAKKHTRDAFGYVTHLGAVDEPPRVWEDIAMRIEPTVDLEKRVRDYKVQVLVLTYDREQHEGAIVLEVWPSTSGEIVVRRLRSGPDTIASRSSRAGRQAGDLCSRRVAVVGAGALGSFIADMLVRAGVGRLTVVDGDVVMPGNLVRHLVGREAVGLPKALAVKNHIVRFHGLSSSQIDAQLDDVIGGDDAVALLRDHDLVVNATADFAVTALLRVSAECINATFLSATLQNDGLTYRIDVLPPVGAAPVLADSVIIGAAPRAPYYEAGCGSPISPTPPHAVIEAAAVTVRHAIGLLLGQPIHPSGEVRHLASIPMAVL